MELEQGGIESQRKTNNQNRVVFQQSGFFTG